MRSPECSSRESGAISCSVELFDLPAEESDLSRAVADVLSRPGPTTRWIYIRDEQGVRSRVVIDTSTGDAAARLRASVRDVWPPRGEIRPLSEDALPLVSVVVPTILKRSVDVEACIASLARLDYPDIEIILVDNRAQSGLPLPPLPDGRFRFIHQGRPGISAARNAGIAEARGAFVAFTDDDVRVDPQWIRNAVSSIEMDAHVACVTGLVLPYEISSDAQHLFELIGGFNGQRFERSKYVLQEPFQKWSLWSYFEVKHLSQSKRELLPFYVAVGDIGVGANMMFRRDIFETVGGFNENLGAGTPTNGAEELEMFGRILRAGGKKLQYDPSILVSHRHRTSMEELGQQVRARGTSVGALLTLMSLRSPLFALDLVAKRLVPAVLRNLKPSREPSEPADEIETPVRRSLQRELNMGYLLGPATLARSMLARIPHKSFALGG